MERPRDESPETIDGVRLIARPDIVAGPEDWPPVWFAFAQHRWNSMVLVPAHGGVSVLAVARALADAGRTYDEPSLGLIEAERVAPSRVQGIVTELRDRGQCERAGSEPGDRRRRFRADDYLWPHRGRDRREQRRRASGLHRDGD